MDTAYDVVDYANLRCVDNSINDSGWQYSGGASSRYLVYYSVENNQTLFSWNKNIGSSSCTSSGLTSSCFDGTYTYYRGSLYANYSPDTVYYIKRTYPIINYKAFSSF